MRVVFFAQTIPDPCGAFFHDVAMARELQRRGHSAIFAITGKTPQGRTGVYRGVQWKHYTMCEREFAGANIWCTPHFPFLKLVRRLNEKFQKPILATMHFGENTEYITEYQRLGKWTEILWIISDHIKNHVLNTVKISPAIKIVESTRPLMLENEVKFNEYGVLPTGDCITMVNANILKGLPIFLQLAKRFPDKKFLGIRPYYNRIQVPENIPNIEWVNIQEDIRNVLSRTRIMVVPSLYESWGRVAFESMYNGIPVLHSRPFERTDSRARPSGSTEGMMEWIQDTQFACSQDNIEEWVEAINTLDNPDTYAEYSRKAYDQTYAMKIFEDFSIIEQKLVDYANTYPSPVNLTAGPQSQVQQVPPSATGMRMPAGQGSALPFRGGRFSVRR